MTLPAGVTACTVTWSPPGDATWVRAWIIADRKLIWTATGVVVYDQQAVEIPLTTGDLATDAAHVDQPGFIDAAGLAVTGWSYTLIAHAKYPNRSVRRYSKTFQVFVGTTSTDLDVLPDGVSQPAVTAPAPTVTSVVGLTGIVTAEDLVGPVSGVVNDSVSATTARQTFYNYFGAGLVAWEDAMRPDEPNFSQFTEGYASKSGHPITSDGAVATNSILSISGHRMRWTDGTPGGTPIRIAGTVLNQEPTRIGGLAVFTGPETTALDTWNPTAASNTHVGANGPIGACVTSFAQGSVQLALYRHGLMLFVVENPIVDPYFSPWSVAFASRIPDDDATPVAYYMDFDRPSSTITVHCPAKMSPVSITDPKFATYWGPRFCWQERRSAATDARVSYLAVGAGVAA